MMLEPIEIQQKAAKSTRSFAVMLGKSCTNMMRRDSMFNKDKSSDLLMLTGEPSQDPPQVNMREKGSRDKGCPRCQLFGCAKASKDVDECDIFGKPTTARVARIAKNEKYQLTVDTYR